MKLLSLTVADNIGELLAQIIEFTHTRQRILIQNINNAKCPGFMPRDLPVEEFSDLLNGAINEHIRNRRLVLCDTESIKFGAGGSIKVRPAVDEYARELLRNNPDEYLELQIDKLMENSLNQRVAAELLRQNQGTVSSFE